MDKKIKSIIDHSLFITISCLDIYCKWLDIISKLKFDELSHRSDKERYLISAFFSYCLIEPVLKTLNNSDEFSRALEGLIQKFHEDNSWCFSLKCYQKVQLPIYAQQLV